MVRMGSCILTTTRNVSVVYFNLSIQLLDFKASQEHGYSFGYDTTGQVVFILTVLAVNLKICSFAFSYSIFLVSVMAISVVSAFITWLILGELDLNQLEHSFFR